mmetsp:Transcript_13101/g.30515  ORF Transcript_13101/g.30515 Transcript_13101/m.30515 type:complete len:96 (+) Transcript_13101:675-962(+)
MWWDISTVPSKQPRAGASWPNVRFVTKWDVECPDRNEKTKHPQQRKRHRFRDPIKKLEVVVDVKELPDAKEEEDVGMPPPPPPPPNMTREEDEEE